MPKALAASIDTSTAVGRHDGELTRSAAYAIQAHSLDLLEPPGIRSALARASANGGGHEEGIGSARYRVHTRGYRFLEHTYSYFLASRCGGNNENTICRRVTALVGCTVGAIAVQELHAQTKPPAYAVVEIDMADQQVYPSMFFAIILT